MINSKTLSIEDNLVEGLRAERTNAVRELYNKFSAAIFGRIFYILNDPEFAEEVLIEVFVEVCKTANNFDTSSIRLFSWISGLAVKHAKEFKNSDRYKNTIGDNGPIYLAKSQSGVQFYRDTLGNRKLVSGLNEELSDVVHTVYFLGKTEEEASIILEIPIENVRKSIHMAITELRNAYETKF